MESPPFNLREARQALNEIHDAHTKDYYTLRFGDKWFTAGTFQSDVAESFALWSKRGFEVVAGPYCHRQLALDQATAGMASDRAVAREQENAKRKRRAEFEASHRD
jgi:hypothetical protein